MKLATHKSSSRDGALLVVSRSGEQAVRADDIAPNLQAALEQWATVEPQLRQRSAMLEAGQARDSFALQAETLMAPLPRSYEWIDGSAFLSHVILVRKARGAEPPPTLETDPLVYQGGGGRFLGPREAIRHAAENLGIDFEAEVAVMTDDVPMGTTAQQAARHIRLLMLVNDVTLRELVPDELAKGFGFLVSKPATAFSPLAVTPDELATSFRDARVHRPLMTWLNGKLFGEPDAGPAMHFSFAELIAHAAQTRDLPAGTIVGSGTVANEDASKGSSCIAERRMREKLASGAVQTPFLKFGDRVRIEMLDEAGHSIFGAIEQTVERFVKPGTQ